MKTALITGITGQDGAYLAKLLLDKGYEVYGTYRRLSTPNFWRLQYTGIFDGVHLVPVDLIDSSSLAEAIRASKPDEIYNLAAQSFVGASFEQPIGAGEVTGLGVTRMLEAVRQLVPGARFYQASTSEMFGNGSPDSQNEITAFMPCSPYAAAKLYGYWVTRIYREGYNIFACNGILFNHECVCENTPVITRDKKTGIISVKRIKDVRRAREKGSSIQQWKLDCIEIWDGDNFVDLYFLTATRRKKHFDDFRCKTINTRHGVIEVTNHHNMLSKDHIKIKARDVATGQMLLHKKFPHANGISALSKEEAVFLGMMAGDGHIAEDGRAKFSNNTKEIMNLFESLWLRVGLGTITKRKYKTEYGESVQAKLNGNARYLKSIRDEIYTYDGFKKVPDRVLNASRDVRLAFLLGYNMCDGLKSNPCTYEFKNFKTNSPLLAQGLLFLISQTTNQNFNITFEEDESYYGYYSINLLSPIDNGMKGEKVCALLETGASQRQICMETGISRKFISKIAHGGQAQLVHHLSKEKEEVKKVLYHMQQPEWVYDLETGSGKFMGGVGSMVVSNSPLRGLEFVTRKITNTVAKIKLGIEKELRLGNLEAKRDWGYAPEYVECMWKVVQHKKPGDYVVATGETHSVKEFVEKAFDAAGLDWEKHVKVDERFMRPLDVNVLCGDCSKAKKELAWEPKTKFKELVRIMVDADMERWQRWQKGERFPWDAPSYPNENKIVSGKFKLERR